MWPAEISRGSLDPFYARAEAGLRVNQPAWNQVSKSGGLWAATLDRAGHTCDPRSPGDQPAALRRRQVVSHGLRFRGEELADHELPGLGGGRGRGGPSPDRGERDPPVEPAPVSLPGQGEAGRSGHQATGRLDRRHRVQGPHPRRGSDGDAGDPDALQAERRAGRRSRRTSASISASTATTSPRSSTTTSRGCASCSACPATPISSRASRSPR